MNNTLVLDIGATAIKIGLIDRNDKLVYEDETPTEAAKGGIEVMKKIITIISSYSSEFDSIGISTCGQVKPDTGEILYATDNMPGYTGTKVKAIIEEHFGVPVEVENDVNSAALGEAFFGAGRSFGDYLCLTYGTGIGGSIIINRKIYSGVCGSAGEFGHFITHAGGRACTCGSYGCYEAYASTTALVSDVRKVTGEIMNGREIFNRFYGGDDVLKRIIDNWINEIVIGLSGLVHIFNPPAVILGGGIMNEEYIISKIKRRLWEMVMPSFREVKAVKAVLGNKAGLMGVGQLVRRSAFQLNQ